MTTKVSTSSGNLNVIHNVVPLQMIVHVEITEKKKKNVVYQKKKKS